MALNSFGASVGSRNEANDRGCFRHEVGCLYRDRPEGKPLAEQPIGWNPDLNDGVRLNIRPLITAGILRWTPKSTKDRGTEPKRPKDQFPWFWDGDTFKSERVNDRHYTNAEK
jgi:hypothetical protein